MISKIRKALRRKLMGPEGRRCYFCAFAERYELVLAFCRLFDTGPLRQGQTGAITRVPALCDRPADLKPQRIAAHQRSFAKPRNSPFSRPFLGRQPAIGVFAPSPPRSLLRSSDCETLQRPWLISDGSQTDPQGKIRFLRQAPPCALLGLWRLGLYAQRSPSLCRNAG